MHSSNPMRDWSDIRLFLAILDYGSLVAASEYLSLTQPSVGRRLSAMEDRLGTPLFVRSGRRMQLTDAGNAILESARRMELEMHAIERSVEVQSKGLCGQVTISATEGTGTEWLTPVLYDFHEKYPDIAVNVQIESRTVDLVRREADIALRLGRPTQPDLIARRLVTLGFGCYASPAYLEKTVSPIDTVESLASHKFVALSMTGDPTDQPSAFCGDLKTHVMAGSYVYMTNSPTAQMSAVKAGFGIGVLSHRWVAMEQGLQRVLPGYAPTEAELWLVAHEELRYSSRIRVLADFIAERVMADECLFRGEL